MTIPLCFYGHGIPYHQKVKFLVEGLVGEERGDQKATQGCYVKMIKEDQK